MIRAIYPGSFDPFHNGHLDIARRASQIFDEIYIAIYAKPAKNLLFTAEERAELTRQSIQALPNVSVINFTGLTTDCAREKGAQVIVRGLRNIADLQSEQQLAWAYNHFAEDIETCCLFCYKEYAYLSSTILKEAASLGGNYGDWASEPVLAASKEKIGN